MPLRLDLDPDLAVEDLTLAFAGREQTRRADLYELVDKLYAAYARATPEGLTDAQTELVLREAFEGYGFVLAGAPAGVANVAAQRLMKAVAERKKAFERALWGTTEGSRGLPDFTASEAPDPAAFLAAP